MIEYECIERCFWHDGLRDVGAVVLASPEEMKGNACFRPLVEIPEPQKPEKKTPAAKPATGKKDK